MLHKYLPLQFRLFVIGILCVQPLAAQEQTPPDIPTAELRTLDSYFPFAPPKTLSEWKARKHRLRLNTQIAIGLWPLPQKSPLNAVIHGKIELEDYTIEKVYFESFPGFYVTGNLYRPKNHVGKTAGVLCPHGHYTNGRFRKTPDDQIKHMLDSGEERYESNARSPLQARSAHLARMGCTVFHYDMIGYADSQQIPASIAHGFRTQRPHLNAKDNYGFFSPMAEMHMQSIM